MRQSSVLLSILLIMAALVIQANADRIPILVIDRGGNPQAEAFIKVIEKDTGDLQDGKTDGQGKFYALMDRNVMYIVVATKGNKTNEWSGLPTDEIIIQLLG